MPLKIMYRRPIYSLGVFFTEVIINCDSSFESHWNQISSCLASCSCISTKTETVNVSIDVWPRKAMF